MRIGLTGLGSTVEQVVRQAERAEADGFTSLWYTGAVAGDPLVAMAIAGRATERVELGTAILHTYSCHPTTMATKAAATAAAIGGDRFTLGIGPSHQPFVEGMLGLSYANPGRVTDEYAQIVGALLRGDAVDFSGEEFQVHVPAAPRPEGTEPIPMLIAALGPRLLRVAGQHTAGTIPWLANATALADHIVPRVTQAAAAADRPAPRIVAGLPVAVHDDEAEARAVAASMFGVYSGLVNYQRIFERGGIAGPSEAAIVGDEASVAAQIEAVFTAGATDFWAAPFAVGDDRTASRARTRALLQDLVGR